MPSGLICTYGFAENVAGAACARALLSGRAERQREHEPAARETRDLDEVAAAQRRLLLEALLLELLEEFRKVRIRDETLVRAHDAPPAFAILSAAL